jgi:hypothetical protein
VSGKYLYLLKVTATSSSMLTAARELVLWYTLAVGVWDVLRSESAQWMPDSIDRRRLVGLWCPRKTNKEGFLLDIDDSSNDGIARRMENVMCDEMYPDCRPCPLR